MSCRRCLQVLLSLALLAVVPPTVHAGIVDADLSVTKTDGAASSTPGTQIVYTITATNAGPADVMGATVADTFPATLTCTWTCVASAGSSCTAAGAGDINDASNLLASGTATYTATCDIDSAATGSLVNTATVSSATPDPTPANDSATDTNTLTPSADLSISGTATPDMLYPGQFFVIDVTVENAGPSDATGVVVTTTLPPWATFDATTGCVEDPNGVPTCTLGTIPAGGMASFTISAQATDTGDDPVELSVTSEVADPTPANDSATVAVASEDLPNPIPTLGEIGRVLMGLLLLGAAFWALRR